MNKIVRSGLFIFLATQCWQAVHAQEYGNLGVFGDNLADPGNIPALLQAANDAGEGPFDTNFPASPPNAGNRFSNGPVAPELLPAILGIDAEQVDNRAVGNSFSAPLAVDLIGGTVLGSGSAIPAPMGRGLTPLDPFDVSSQVDNYIADAGRIRSNDVMVLYASANDGALALNTVLLTDLTDAAADAVVTSGAQVNAVNTANSAQRLIDNGARLVVLPNLPDFGRTPIAGLGGLAGVQGARLFSTTTNTALAEQAVRLNRENPAAVFVVDTFSLLEDIAVNPAKYNLDDVTAPCTLTPECVDGGDEAQARFLFWDTFYPTTAANAINAAFIADTLVAPTTIAPQAETSRFLAERYAARLVDRADLKGNRLALTIGLEDWERDADTRVLEYDIDVNRIEIAGSLELGDRLRGGITLGYDDGDVEMQSPDAGFDFSSVRFGVFLNTSTAVSDVTLAWAHSEDEFDSITRVTGVVGQIARGDTQGSNDTLLLDFYRTIYPYEQASGFSIQPNLRLGYSRSEVDGYRERGAVGLDQAVFSRSTSKTFLELGATIFTQFDLGSWELASELSVRYHTALDADEQEVDTALRTIPDVVRSESIDVPDDDYLEVGIQLPFFSGDHTVLSVQAAGIVGGGEMSGLSAAVTADWIF